MKSKARVAEEPDNEAVPLVTLSVSAEAGVAARQGRKARLVRTSRECIALFGALFILSSLRESPFQGASRLANRTHDEEAQTSSGLGQKPIFLIQIVSTKARSWEARGIGPLRHCFSPIGAETPFTWDTLLHLQRGVWVAKSGVRLSFTLD